jgi:isocitrate/isopropylmalate dehydrogenase
MLSAALMLNHIGERQAAARLYAGIAAVYAEGQPLTRDVGGVASTGDFTSAVIRHICANSL